MAWCLGNLAAVSYGAKMVFPGEGFDPLATLEAVQAEGCTALHGVPTMFAAMLDHPEFARFRSAHPAHGDHGRLTMSRAIDGPCDSRHALPRYNYRLWYD